MPTPTCRPASSRTCASGCSWDVLFVLEEADLRRAPDVKHYQLAQQLRRTLVTLDRDYLDDRRFPLDCCGGVLVIQAPDERQLSALLDRIDRIAVSSRRRRRTDRAAAGRPQAAGQYRMGTGSDRPRARRHARPSRWRSTTPATCWRARRSTRQRSRRAAPRRRWRRCEGAIAGRLSAACSASPPSIPNRRRSRRSIAELGAQVRRRPRRAGPPCCRERRPRRRKRGSAPRAA